MLSWTVIIKRGRWLECWHYRYTNLANIDWKDCISSVLFNWKVLLLAAFPNDLTIASPLQNKNKNKKKKEKRLKSCTILAEVGGARMSFSHPLQRLQGRYRLQTKWLKSRPHAKQCHEQIGNLQFTCFFLLLFMLKLKLLQYSRFQVEFKL